MTAGKVDTHKYVKHGDCLYDQRVLWFHYRPDSLAGAEFAWEASHSIIVAWRRPRPAEFESAMFCWSTAKRHTGTS